MKTPTHPTTSVSDGGLIAELARLAACERRATSDLLRALMEFDARRLYLAEGYPSLFAYCTQVLHYAEHAALNRIEVARAARQLPRLLEFIEAGALNITGARLLAPHLTAENADALLTAARHKSKRDIEEMIAALRPRPGVPAIVRKLPSSRQPRLGAGIPVTTIKEATLVPPVFPAASVAPAVPTRPVIAPLAPERYKVQFTITRETHNKLRQVQDLMRHVIPSGDPAAIFDRALTLLLDDLQRKRFAATHSPRASRGNDTTSRHIPASVKRAVWQRDGGRCAFAGSRGVCGERGFLEFHHVVPFAAGGSATVANIELRCRTHNAYEASLFFGADGANVVREVVEYWGTPRPAAASGCPRQPSLVPDKRPVLPP